jgi:hypothetical protein
MNTGFEKENLTIRALNSLKRSILGVTHLLLILCRHLFSATY